MRRRALWIGVGVKPVTRSGAIAAGTAPGRRALHQPLVGGLDRVERWIRQRWLLLFNLAAGVTLLGAALAPALDALGLGAGAAAIRTIYLLLCPQRPSHSYFILGFQMALEQRPLAMFAAQLLGGLAYTAGRGRLRPLGWPILAVVALPLAWDVVSQLLGRRESDWFTRTWTGALFTLALVAWLYPRLHRGLWPARPGAAGVGSNGGVVIRDDPPSKG